MKKANLSKDGDAKLYYIFKYSLFNDVMKKANLSKGRDAKLEV